MRVSDFVINLFWNRKESDRRKTKSIIFENFFHFQIVQTFGNLEIDFDINLKKFFW